MRIRTLAVTAVGLGLLLGQFGAASASTLKSTFRVNGTTAYAEWFVPVGNGFTDTFIATDASSMGTIVFYGRCSWDGIAEFPTCVSGLKDNADQYVAFGKKLSGASVTPVTIDLMDDWGAPAGAVTLSGNWTGFGEVLKGKTRVVSKFGNFREIFHDNTSMRRAATNITVDGSGLGVASDAGLVQYRAADFFFQK